MRTTLTALVAVLAVACGKPAGSDAGVSDAGTDAGSFGPVCLVDSLDAGDDDGGTGSDFSCRGQPAQPGGQAQLLISGKVTRAGFIRFPVPDTHVDLLDTQGNVLATAVAQDGGPFTLSADAGCLPLDGQLRATYPDPDAGFYLTYYSPGAPWRYDRDSLELVLFDQTSRGLAAGLASVTLVNGAAVLALTVTDCAGLPVENAVVTTADDAGTVRYVGPSGLPTTTLSATGTSGQVVLFNLPGTTADVMAIVDGGIIGRRVVQIHGDAVTGTTLEP